MPHFKNTAPFVILLLALAGLGGWYHFSYDTQQLTQKDTTNTTKTTRYTIQRIVDGDTIHVTDVSGTKESIRLLGIDAPEIDYENPQNNDCYAWESKATLEELLQHTKTIVLTEDPSQGTRDTYNRLLGYIQTDMHADINNTLIEFGVAREYTHKDNAHARQDVYRKTEEIARNNRVGLWNCAE